MHAKYSPHVPQRTAVIAVVDKVNHCQQCKRKADRSKHDSVWPGSYALLPYSKVTSCSLLITDVKEVHLPEDCTGRQRLSLSLVTSV